LAAIASVVASVAVIAALGVAMPVTTTYVNQFQFTFPLGNSEKQKDVLRRSEQSAETLPPLRYPNGLTFSLNDLIDPSTLSAVYDEFKLNDYGIKRETFYASFAIRPFGPTEADIAERFRQQMADRRITFTERERLEAQLKTQLEQASRGAAELTFTLRERFPLPKEVGRAIVQTIPLMWSRIAIERKGVLLPAGIFMSPAIVPEDAIKGQTLPMAILAVTEASFRLFSRLSELRGIPGMTTIRDGQTGKSFRDLEMNFNDLEFLRLNGLRAALQRFDFGGNREQAAALVEQHIQNLSLAENDAQRTADATSASIKEYVNSITGLKGRPAEQRSSQGGGFAGTTTIPQLTDNFIDKILSMSDRGREEEEAFISDMMSRQIKLSEKLLLVHSQREKWAGVLAMLQAGSSDRKPLDDATKAELTQSVAVTADALNKTWATLTRMQSDSVLSRGGYIYSGRLYEPYIVPHDVVVSHPVLNVVTLLICLSLAVFVFLAVWAVRATMFFRAQRPGAV